MQPLSLSFSEPHGAFMVCDYESLLSVDDILKSQSCFL